jgi:subtilisin family serine protease
MASTASILLHCSLLLVLIIFQSAQSSTIEKPHDATVDPSSSHTYIIQTNHLAKPSQFASLERWYASMVATHSPRPRATTNSSSRLLHTYGTVMHGYAARLTDGEARRMSSTPGVSGVYKSGVRYTQTTRSPEFIGLHEEYGAWPDSEFGDGVIVGFIDTGIWPESASFNDSGLGPVRSTWKGTCVDAEGFNASFCNNKLVGAKVFAAELDGAVTPRDMVGHGTHVSGTAAGSEVRGASLFGFSRGTAHGVAPRARIAMYKACNKECCDDHSIVAAIDSAVRDGVDILSISVAVGGLNRPFYDDVVAIALFGAERRGVFVVVAGGNSGPHASTVHNVAPWMTTVGAATMDRAFPATLKLGNGLVLEGQSLYARKANGTGMLPLLQTSCGYDDLTPDRIAGRLVVCDDQGSDRDVQSGAYAQSAGGAGIIAVESTESFPEAVHGQAFTLPGLTLSYNQRDELDKYMSSVPYPVASLGFSCDTVTGDENRAPVVAGFSSRGPSTVAPEIMKPDLVAPGVNILAPWSDASLSDPHVDRRMVEYNVKAGTSVACAHVAGVAALIKKVHGDWTPAMVRSALLTTANRLDNRRDDITDNARGGGRASPLAAGAGIVNPPLAMDPGLVYDAGTKDYLQFFCSLNYTAKQMRRFLPEATKCRRTLAGGAANLNYPTLVAVFDGRTCVRTLTRTVTKVSEQPESYNVTFAAPEGIIMSVTPMTLVFKGQNEKQSYRVEFRSESEKQAGAWEFGHITLVSADHDVNATVAFTWV